MDLVPSSLVQRRGEWIIAPIKRRTALFGDAPNVAYPLGGLYGCCITRAENVRG